MGFVDREIIGAPIHLTRGGVHNLDVGPQATAGLHDRQLAHRVDREIVFRILHAGGVADLGRQVEQDILAFQHRLDHGAVSQVPTPELDVREDALDVVKIGPGARHCSVDNPDLGIQTNKSLSQIAADEAQAARDDDSAIAIPLSQVHVTARRRAPDVHLHQSWSICRTVLRTRAAVKNCDVPCRR